MTHIWAIKIRARRQIIYKQKYQNAKLPSFTSSKNDADSKWIYVDDETELFIVGCFGSFLCFCSHARFMRGLKARYAKSFSSCLATFEFLRFLTLPNYLYNEMRKRKAQNTLQPWKFRRIYKWTFGPKTQNGRWNCYTYVGYEIYSKLSISSLFMNMEWDNYINNCYRLRSTTTSSISRLLSGEMFFLST